MTEDRSFFVYGGTETNDRERIRQLLKSWTTRLLSFLQCSSLNINIRNLHNIIFSSPSKSPIRILQSIGRGLRLGEQKQSVTVYDIADDLSIDPYKNFTLDHFAKRVEIYNEEQFNYEIHNVELK